jgi:hypothetical protein
MAYSSVVPFILQKYIGAGSIAGWRVLQKWEDRAKLFSSVRL